VYYGQADAGTNAALWTASTNLGYTAAGTNAIAISNLTAAAIYYVRSAAWTNSAATNWSGWTSFWTRASAPTNLPATSARPVLVDTNGALVHPTAAALLSANPTLGSGLASNTVKSWIAATNTEQQSWTLGQIALTNAAALSNVWTVSRPVTSNKLHVAVYGQSYVAGSSTDGYGGDTTLTNPLAHAWMTYNYDTTNMTAQYSTNVVALATNMWGTEITGAKTMFGVQGVTNYFTRRGWGGAPISYLIPGTDYYRSFTNQIELTKSNWPAAGNADCLWYLQNVADNNYDSVNGLYWTNLNLVINGFRTHVGNSSAPVFLMGANGFTGTSATFDFNKMRQLERRFAAANPNVYFVRCDDITLPDPTVTSHMDAAGYKELGRRFADATLAHFGGVTNKSSLVTGKVFADETRTRHLDAGDAVMESNTVRTLAADTLTMRYDKTWTNQYAVTPSAAFTEIKPGHRWPRTFTSPEEYIYSMPILTNVLSTGTTCVYAVNATSSQVAKVVAGQAVYVNGVAYGNHTRVGEVVAVDAAQSQITVASVASNGVITSWGGTPYLSRFIPLVRVIHGNVLSSRDTECGIQLWARKVGDATKDGAGWVNAAFELTRTGSTGAQTYSISNLAYQSTALLPMVCTNATYVSTVSPTNYIGIYRASTGAFTSWQFFSALYRLEALGFNFDLQATQDY
jgi:hypothetical protein